MMCPMVFSSPVATMFMWEKAGSYASDTTRLSMLNPRRANTSATRLSTPNLLATYRLTRWRLIR